MSEPIKKLEQSPESYSPKDKPEILNMAKEANNALRHISELHPFWETFEIFYMPASRVIGVEQAYKSDGSDGGAGPQWARVCSSDIWKTLGELPLVIPNTGFGWTCDDNHETGCFSYIVAMLTPAGTPVPEGCQYRDIPPALVAVGRWDEHFDEVKEQMNQRGYKPCWDDKGCGFNAELYFWEEESLPHSPDQEWRWLIPCKKENPESYSPKEKPIILELASEVALKKQLEPKAAVSAIKAKARNTVRIIELPACKMVTSGPANGPDAFAPEGALMRFCEWFTEFDKERVDRFYPRDFLWSPPDGGFQWGYAVPGMPEDTGGFEVIDFPGGLYAVAISVDADGKDHNRIYKGIQKWVKKSGCFVLDETDNRRSLGNITSPEFVKEIMGYGQMDLYMPIRIKEDDTK